MIVEIGGINDNDQRVRLALAFLCPEQDVPGNGLVRAGRVEAVCARQVDELDRTSVGERQSS